MSYEYKYKPKRFEQSSKPRPYAEVGLKINRNLLFYDFLIDSGADRTIINHGLGEILGFTTTKGEKPIEVGGVGGFIHGFIKPIKLLIAEKEISLDILWVQSDRIPLILGQDVFEYFKITFIKKEKRIIFE